MIITIDGPTASGKSSVARVLARELGYYYVYTGMLYRAIAYALVQTYGYSVDQLAQVPADVLESICADSRLVYTYTDSDGVQIFFDGVAITPELKSARVDDWTSRISSQKLVRAAATRLQHQIAQHANILVEGRDCGSVVFPQADYKFFITASLSVRACRWAKDQARLGFVFSPEEAQAAVSERDSRDAQRTHSPLVIPEDAHVIDNSNLSLQETVQHILSLID